ncbi:MAG TPA: YafY family protein [Candidatus Limiplasma sp.]|nr:YafY family protein [Candidatus Limiplasma sp.]
MKVDRLVSMVMILLDQKRISAEALAAMFEVSPRTVYRDIASINMAGIPIQSTPGVGGGFEIMQAYKLDRKVFSSADLSAILMGLSSLSNMIRGEELVNALAKVKSFIPAERARDIELKANQIHVDLRPWSGERDVKPYLETLKIALQDHRLLSFVYTDRHGQQTTRTAEPYQLVLKGSHWYWQGFCYLRGDFRLFKLSRTTNLRIQPAIFSPRNPPKPILDYSDEIAAMQTPIALRIHRSIMDRVLDYCAYEHFSPDGDAHYIVQFPFIENDYYYDLLFSFGDQCECVAPLRIRAEMKRRIHCLAAIYEKAPQCVDVLT